MGEDRKLKMEILNQVLADTGAAMRAGGLYGAMSIFSVVYLAGLVTATLVLWCMVAYQAMRYHLWTR